MQATGRARTATTAITVGIDRASTLARAAVGRFDAELPAEVAARRTPGGFGGVLAGPALCPRHCLGRHQAGHAERDAALLCPGEQPRPGQLGYSGLISTLRNRTTPRSLGTPLSSLAPRPCCRAMRPVGYLACLAPSTVFCPFRTTDLPVQDH